MPPKSKMLFGGIFILWGILQNEKALVIVLDVIFYVCPAFCYYCVTLRLKKSLLAQAAAGIFGVKLTISFKSAVPWCFVILPLLACTCCYGYKNSCRFCVGYFFLLV